MGSNSLHNQQFISLLTDHQEVVRSYIISQVPGSPDVRDILQETNILLWKKMDKFELGSNFGVWACTVAYYKILDYRRKQVRDEVLLFNDELLASFSQEAGQRTPDILEQKRLALRHCLSKVSDKDKLLLDARYKSNRGDLSSLSAKTGRSRASLRVSLHRLRASLHKCITKRIATLEEVRYEP